MSFKKSYVIMEVACAVATAAIIGLVMCWLMIMEWISPSEFRLGIFLTVASALASILTTLAVAKLVKYRK